jgi:hypothetical protein
MTMGFEAAAQYQSTPSVILEGISLINRIEISGWVEYIDTQQCAQAHFSYQQFVSD